MQYYLHAILYYEITCSIFKNAAYLLRLFILFDHILYNIII